MLNSKVSIEIFLLYKAAATQSTTAQTETVRYAGNVISQEFHY